MTTTYAIGPRYDQLETGDNVEEYMLRLACIDSFVLVGDGDGGSGKAAVGFALHCARFKQAVGNVVALLLGGGGGGTAAVADAEAAACDFVRACVEQGKFAVGGKEDYFPRLECWIAKDSTGDGGSSDTGKKHKLAFVLRMRPLPTPLRTEERVFVGEAGDPRRAPQIKGQDLDVCDEMRRVAAQHGCDEHLIITFTAAGADGTAGAGAADGGSSLSQENQGESSTAIVLEGAYSSIVWWEEDEDGRDVLCTPTLDMPVLASVTRAVVEKIAASTVAHRTGDGDGNSSGICIRRRNICFEELRTRECWVMSALHGIRWVKEWVVGKKTTATATGVAKEGEDGSGGCGEEEEEQSFAGVAPKMDRLQAFREARRAMMVVPRMGDVVV